MFVCDDSARTLAQTAQDLGLPMPAAIERLQELARRVTTPLGEAPEAGHMVWHGWQPPAGVEPTGLPLVLLHGGSGSWTHWLRVIEPLRQAGYSLWIADLPGFGESDGVPGGIDVDTLIDPLARGIAQLLGSRSGGPVCDLVGFSFGGMTAGLLAAAHPDLARRLIIVGAPAMGMTEGRVVRLKGWRHLQGLDAQMQAHRYNLAALMLNKLTLIDEDTLALHALNVARDRLPRRRLSQTDILAKALQQVKVPVAAIYGEHDPLYEGQLPELQALMQAQCQRPLHWQVIEGAGHWVQHEDPVAFCAALHKALV